MSNKFVGLRLPLLGVDLEVDALNELKKRCVDLKFNLREEKSKEKKGNDKKKNNSIPLSDIEIKDEIEKALGRYLNYTGEYKKIIKLFFPKRDTIKKKFKNFILWKYEKEEDKKEGNKDEGENNLQLSEIPLFAYPFARRDSNSKKNNGSPSEETNTESNDEECKSDFDKKSAWVDFMYELGEFKLDEEYPNSREEVNRILNYGFLDTSGGVSNSCIWMPKIEEGGEDLLKDIWGNLNLYDEDEDEDENIVITFIDDNENFGDMWGLPDGVCKRKIDFTNNDKISEEYNIIWINPPNEPFSDEKKDGLKETEKVIRKIINNKEKNRNNLFVFVIDLMFKEKEEKKEDGKDTNNRGINRVKGDDIIEYIRKQKDCNALIVGFTGGNSPFVINSAVRAGADNVIYKNRNTNIKDTSTSPGHGSIVRGSSMALFDLLWSLSWNISVWRFMEVYKEELSKISKKNGGSNLKELDRFLNIEIKDKFFGALSNASPFWRQYLKDWIDEVDGEKLKFYLRKRKSE